MRPFEQIILASWILDEIVKSLQENTSREEWVSIAIDCTIRCLRRIKGQHDYRSSAAQRNAALYPDGVAKRKLLVVIGRTGAIGMMEPIIEEKAEYISEKLCF